MVSWQGPQGAGRKEPSESLQLFVLRVTNLKTGVSSGRLFDSLFSVGGGPASTLRVIIPQNEVWAQGREERAGKLNKQKLLRVTNIH